MYTLIFGSMFIFPTLDYSNPYIILSGSLNLPSFSAVKQLYLFSFNSANSPTSYVINYDIVSYKFILNNINPGVENVPVVFISISGSL